MSAFRSFKDSVGDTAFVAGVKGTDDPAAYAGTLISAALSLLGLVLTAYMIYGGFLWMTAQGSEENIKKAKAIIKNCVIGMVLIFATGAIATAILDVVTNSRSEGAVDMTITEEEAAANQ